MLISAEMAQTELLRRRAWEDFYVFAKFVCGKTLMEEVPHRELSEFLTYGLDKSEILGLPKSCCEPMPEHIRPAWQGTLKKLIMLPRNSFKSSVIQALVLWLLWHNQNLRVMLDSETFANAKLYLAGIKDMLQNNEVLRTICADASGEFLLEPAYKTTGGFVEEQVILQRRTKVGMKEPSIFCSGVDNAKTGMHPDVIVMDDIVSERNVTTEQQLSKVKNHYRYSLSLLELGGGALFVIGTRYHMADLYGELIEGGTLDTLVRPAVLESGDLYFPTRLTHEFLRQMRKEQGSHIYHCQYMLSPVNQDDAVFKREYLQYIDDLEVKPVIADRYITLDPAISKNERADNSALLLLGVDARKRRFIEKVIRGRFTPFELIDKLFELAEGASNLRAVGVESVAFQKVLIYLVKDEMRRRGKYFQLRELKADRDKIRRALAVQPAWENGDVYIDRYAAKDLVRELLEFPFSEHDDCVDAFTYTEQMLKPYSKGSRKDSEVYVPLSFATGY